MAFFLFLKFDYPCDDWTEESELRVSALFFLSLSMIQYNLQLDNSRHPSEKQIGIYPLYRQKQPKRRESR